MSEMQNEPRENPRKFYYKAKTENTDPYLGIIIWYVPSGGHELSGAY